MFTIADLERKDTASIRMVAELLAEGFQGTGGESWLNLDSALEEVRASLAPERISRIAVLEDGTIAGWIAGIQAYDGHAWELHPLVVAPAFRGRGIGRALVKDFERLVKEHGATTVFLGADDEDQRTSLGGVDLYPNVLKCLSQIQNLQRHPYEFYQKLGYSLVGVIPDANGPGKPDIWMAKRV